MKYRAGFVSNSSSSSFIITNRGEPTVTINDTSVRVSSLVSCTPTKISTIEALQKYICEEHDWIPEVDRTPEKMAVHCQDTSWYDDAQAAIADGKQVYTYWIDDYDETAGSLLGHFDVVYGD